MKRSKRAVRLFTLAEGRSRMGRAIPVLLAVATLAFAGPVLAQAQCPADLIGYWPLDGTAEEAVNGFPGTLVGNIQFVVGVVGQAARFDGDFTQVDAGTHPELAFGGTEMTLTAWINPAPDTTIESGNDDLSVVITSRSFCGDGNWQLYDRHHSAEQALYASKWTASGPESFFQSAILPQIGQWSHVAVTVRDNVARFYVNGAFVQQVEDFGSPLDIKSDVLNVQLGADSCSSYFTGDMDEVAVYATALSDSQVLDLYDSGVNGLGQCVQDADADGVGDDLDVCPGTTGEALVDGCDCAQILDFKPGKGGQCNAGTLNVFRNRTGWARSVPFPGSGE